MLVGFTPASSSAAAHDAQCTTHPAKKKKKKSAIGLLALSYCCPCAYFHALGRGEQIRLLLQKFNKNFEDRRISFDDWSELKPRFPGQQLPCWEENGLYMNESTAVLRYLGKKFGCYPLNNLSMACRVDEVVEFLDGFITFFMMTSEQKDMSQETQALWRENV